MVEPYGRPRRCARPRACHLIGTRFECPVWAVALIILVCAPACAAQQAFTGEMDNAHCGKKFRIATHVAPPFINVDINQCIDQKCPPEAFGDNGGVAYKLMMEHILPQLRTYCKESGYPEFVDFEWYLPPVTTDFASAESPVQMVCQGQFHSSFLRPLTDAQPTCPSGIEYKGPSPADEYAKIMQLPTCDGAYEPQNVGCVSSGPDLVIGSVHVTRNNIDMLDFSVPYMPVEQLLVKRKKDDSIPTLMRDRVDQVFSIFQPFSWDGWVAILAEMLLVVFILLTIEAAIFVWLCNCCAAFKVNEMISPGFHGMIDCWYWAFSMSFNTGASGKYPITAGGKIYITGHCIFVTIIAASYTGAVGPAIMSADTGAINTFDTLKSGSISVVTVGPRWDAALFPAPYLGNNLGTAIPTPDIIVPKSVQFNMLQSEMRVNSATTFSIITAQHMHSTGAYGKPFLHTKDDDPCSPDDATAGVTLGVYDMVRCKTMDKEKLPHSTIYDAPQVVFEMMQRYNNTGKCSLVAKGGRFGSSSYGIGFPKNTSLPHIFSRAIERVKFKGQVDKLLREAFLYDADNKCTEPLDDSESLVFSLLSGLFMVVFGLIVVGLLGSFVVRFLGLSFSTLSDVNIRRTQEKDDERDYKDKQLLLVHVKPPSTGRSARMKGRKMTGYSKGGRGGTGPGGKTWMIEGYEASYTRPETEIFDARHPSSKHTKQVLTEIHDYIERFEDRVGFIAQKAEAAQSQVQASLAENQREASSTVALSRMSRAGAHSIRGSVASRSQARSGLSGGVSAGDSITMSSERISSPVTGPLAGRSILSSKSVSSKSVIFSKSVATTQSRTSFVSDELVFADFTGAFPRKGAGI